MLMHIAKLFLCILLIVPIMHWYDANVLAIPPPPINNELYANVLSNYVDDKGNVNYKDLKKDRIPLDGYVKYLGQIKKDEFNSWSPQKQMALWINAYNAFTLKAIIDNYPIKPRWKTRFTFPNGIRQIPGVWDKLNFDFLGKTNHTKSY